MRLRATQAERGCYVDVRNTGGGAYTARGNTARTTSERAASERSQRADTRTAEGWQQ